jgi:hypothetical protein
MVVRDETILLVKDDYPDDELLTRRSLKKYNVRNDVVVLWSWPATEQRP